MAWTTPKTWVSGELVTETQLNLHIRDNLDVLKAPLTDGGKFRSFLSSYLADMDGSNLTGIPTLAGDTNWTGENDFDSGSSGRLVFPVVTDPWAT